MTLRVGMRAIGYFSIKTELHSTQSSSSKPVTRALLPHSPFILTAQISPCHQNLSLAYHTPLKVCPHISYQYLPSEGLSQLARPCDLLLPSP